MIQNNLPHHQVQAVPLGDWRDSLPSSSCTYTAWLDYGSPPYLPDHREMQVVNHFQCVRMWAEKYGPVYVQPPQLRRENQYYEPVPCRDLPDKTDRRECFQNWLEFLPSWPGELCATHDPLCFGYRNQTDTYFGDGGGLVCDGKLVGVALRAYHAPDYYTPGRAWDWCLPWRFVRLARHKNWLKQQMEN